MTTNGKNAPSLSADEMLSCFAEQVTNMFSFLEPTFHLPYLSSERHGTELVVTYANPSAKIAFLMEPYCRPWVVVEKKKGTRWKSLGLHRLYKKLHAKTLPSHGAKDNPDIYDTSNLPVLKDVIEKELPSLLSLL